MSVQGLSAAAVAAAVRQISVNSNFAAANPHLTAAEIAAISNGIWPAVPVFSPYADNHDGYTSVRYAGTKYLCHRITYQSFYHNLTSVDVSHTLYLGKNTTRNINPRHLTNEHNILNQTRKCCALFFEHHLDRWADSIGFPAWWSFRDFDNWVGSVNTACHVVHAQRPCCTSSRFWVELDSFEDLRSF